MISAELQTQLERYRHAAYAEVDAVLDATTSDEAVFPLKAQAAAQAGQLAQREFDRLVRLVRREFPHATFTRG